MDAKYFVEIRKGRGKAVWTPAESLQNASEQVRNVIRLHDLTMHTFTGGKVVDDSERVVARVSYNGKIWGPEPYPKAVLLWSPF